MMARTKRKTYVVVEWWVEVDGCQGYGMVSGGMRGQKKKIEGGDGHLCDEGKGKNKARERRQTPSLRRSF